MAVNEEDEDSPFPEVRASVSNIDDPTMPVVTFRVIVISFFFSILISVVMVVVYPLGKLLAAILPTHEYYLPSWLGGYAFSLNPGPFNIKEHTLIAAATTIAVNPSYMLHYLMAKEVFLETSKENTVCYFGSPLVVPWWCTCNMILGFVVMAWIVMPAMYFTNVWQLGYFPFTSISIWDKYGHEYQVQRVLDFPTGTFNPAKYEAYSPVMLSLGFIISYFCGFANLAALLFHTLFNHNKDIWQAFQTMSAGKMDIHAKLMQKYKSVPSWWYTAMFVMGFCILLIADDHSTQKLSATALIVGILITILYLLPSGYVLAQTGQLIGNNIFADLVGGYLLSQQQQNFMAFKALTVQALIGALQVTANMKLGHYMKIPPRTMVVVQLISVLVVSCAQVAVKTLMVVTVSDLCSSTQSLGLQCIMANAYNSSALLWSAVGPHYIFFSQSFQFVLWGLLVGALVPAIVWLMYKWTKARWLLYINAPLIFTSMTNAPASMSINFTCWFVVSFIFQYWMRKHRFHWWSKYNFVTADALDLGTVVSELLIFLAIRLPLHVSPVINWWGNRVVFQNADIMRKPWLSMPTNGISIKNQGS
ncbi:unnamed protein product [Malassezia sympodialis ATCC 42132]|uniref:uncharacterized protein n=1 Tax=Malassezia sympodialis (strain ATCC 42132) TaxID=1230383 RepID=UPI0002C2C582|nr:uncharacterized protein MSY001_1097 [Malassezia sympodialis ATCC 42132]CCU98391.1 unnamed protein product [Malassezia sympodialis ATCC 42132]|eukprot:XP_018739698.1 uncharacterized protein MSY001_1097 [Malassezia sympodialis ATCC 42132]